MKGIEDLGEGVYRLTRYAYGVRLSDQLVKLKSFLASIDRQVVCIVPEIGHGSQGKTETFAWVVSIEYK